MALTECKECGTQFSTQANACPKCGAKKPANKKSGCLLLIVGFLSIGFLAQVLAPSSLSKQSVQSSGVTNGMLADSVLEKRGKADSIKQTGQDDNGLLVEWQYPDETYLMARRLQDGIEAYRVIKITQQSSQAQVKPAQKDETGRSSACDISDPEKTYHKLQEMVKYDRAAEEPVFITIKPEFWPILKDDPSQRRQLMQGIVNIDGCLVGRSRNLYLFDPNSNMIGRASSSNGIQMM